MLEQIMTAVLFNREYYNLDFMHLRYYLWQTINLNYSTGWVRIKG